MLDRHQKNFWPSRDFKPVFLVYLFGLHISHQMIIFHENKWATFFFFWKKNKFILAIRCAPYSDGEWKNTTILRRPIIFCCLIFLVQKEMGREKLVC